MSAGTALLGAFQRPVLDQDPSVASIPGGATLTAVSVASIGPNAGTLYAVVNTDVSVHAELDCGSQTATATGSHLVLSVPAAANEGAVLRITANSGPSFAVQASVVLTTLTTITLADLAQIFTEAGQLLVGTGPGSAELLPPPGSALDFLGNDGAGMPVWKVPPSPETAFTAPGQLLVGTGLGTGELLNPGPTGDVLTIEPSGLPGWSPPSVPYQRPRWVSTGGTGLWTSPDPLTTWAKSPLAVTSTSPNGIAYAPQLGRFVMFAETGGNWHVYTSSDAATWTDHGVSPAGAAVAVLALTWAPSLGLFVMSANNNGALYWSADGATWTLASFGVPAPTSHFNYLGWADDQAIFIAANNAALGGTYISSDGKNWVQGNNIGANPAGGIAYSPTLDVFVIPTSTGIASSPDGATWTNHAITSGTFAVVWDGALGVFVALNQEASTTVWAYTSPDGSTWTHVGTFTVAAGTTDPTVLAYSPYTSELVALAPDAAWTSSDAITWTDVANTMLGTDLAVGLVDAG